MARAQSVVLSKEEKKAALTEIKAGIKEAKQCLKNIDGSVKAAEKAHALGLKQAAKDRAISTKVLLSLEAKLASMTAPT